MARITCKYSGVVFDCEHMPISLSSSEYYHPLFSIPKKKLLALTGDWAANRLTPTQNYLLYLALLHSTDLLIWRAPARYTDKTQAIIAANMEPLIQIIGKIDLIHHPAFVLPRMNISHDTAGLENSYYWIQAWKHNYKEFMEDFIDAQKREEVKIKIERREHSLEKLIKTANVNPDVLADNLAMWARIMCDFPEDEIIHPHTGKKVILGDFWEEIIRACTKEERIWRYAKGTIHTVLDHCETNMNPEAIGTIHSFSLLKLLREGKRKAGDYLGMGDIDLAGKTTQFKLLDASASAEDANILAAIQAAPDVEPVKSNYPTLGAYIRAKLNWDMKKRAGGQS